MSLLLQVMTTTYMHSIAMLLNTSHVLNKQTSQGLNNTLFIILDDCLYDEPIEYGKGRFCYRLHTCIYSQLCLFRADF